jgi:hypothetical protein
MTLQEAINKGKINRYDILRVHHMGVGYWIENTVIHFEKGYIELVLHSDTKEISLTAVRRTVECTCVQSLKIARGYEMKNIGDGDKLLNDFPIIAVLDGDEMLPISDIYRDEDNCTTYLVTDSYDAFLNVDLIKNNKHAMIQAMSMLTEFADMMQTIKEIESENEDYTKKINLAIKMLQQMRNLQSHNETYKGLIDKLKEEKSIS